MNIVLHEPGIALNTGNIGRTCAATNTSLHLIRPYGFRISEKEIKRAGMDYWEKIDLQEYIDFEDFMEMHPELSFAGEASVRTTDLKPEHNAMAADSSLCSDTLQDKHMLSGMPQPASAVSARSRLWFATTKARHAYTDVSFGPDDFIMFGNESRGIPEEILVQHPDACIRIPMWGDIRSLNLANSAAIILYEALRQNNFDKMQKKGELHHLSWD